MTRKQKIILIVLAAVVLTVVGRLFLNSPIAHIQFAGETVGHEIFGKWNVTSSLIAAWVAMGALITVAFLATRKMQMVPRGLQNFAEAVISWLLGIAESVAGRRDGRMFFPLAATIFLFIIVANWSALLPVFGTIGRIEGAEALLEEKLKDTVKDYNGRHKDQRLDHEVVWRRLTQAAGQGQPVPADLREVVEDLQRDAGDEKLVLFNSGGVKMIPIGFGVVKEIRLQEYWDFEKWKSRTGKVSSGDAQVDLEGKTAGVLVPYLRSMNTDLMNPLAFALVAMFMVEYWGMRANGFGSYVSRFINLKGGPIGFAVGFLESISELSRVISFSFRLLGNMFAGEVLIFAFLFLLPIMAGVLVLPLILETFVGFIQAVIFAALTLIFAALAVESHEGHKEEAGPAKP